MNVRHAVLGIQSSPSNRVPRIHHLVHEPDEVATRVAGEDARYILIQNECRAEVVNQFLVVEGERRTSSRALFHSLTLAGHTHVGARNATAQKVKSAPLERNLNDRRMVEAVRKVVRFAFPQGICDDTLRLVIVNLREVTAVRHVRISRRQQLTLRLLNLGEENGLVTHILDRLRVCLHA